MVSGNSHVFGNIYSAALDQQGNATNTGTIELDDYAFACGDTAMPSIAELVMKLNIYTSDDDPACGHTARNRTGVERFFDGLSGSGNNQYLIKTLADWLPISSRRPCVMIPTVRVTGIRPDPALSMKNVCSSGSTRPGMIRYTLCRNI